jgi:hypothetical protein
MFLRTAVAGIAAAGLALAGPAGTAAASGRGSHLTSGDAVYAVTARRLGGVETWVTLPHASRLARDLGSLSATVQLWTARTVLDLKVVACTDASCRLGGRPVSRDYHLVFSVYDRKTRTLVCSTSAAGRLQCPGVPRSWNSARFAPGHTVELDLAYTIPYDFVFASVADQGNGSGQNYNYPVTPNYVPAKPTRYFTEARIGVELGTSPWAGVPMRAPRAAVRLASFDRPPPPPYAVEVWPLTGFGGGIASSQWGHHAVRATVAGSPARPAAEPGTLWDDGYGFTVYLEP